MVTSLSALGFVRDPSRDRSLTSANPLWRALAAMAHALRRERRIRRDMAYLTSCDERMLDDIGLQQGKIARSIRSGRALDSMSRWRRNGSLDPTPAPAQGRPA